MKLKFFSTLILLLFLVSCGSKNRATRNGSGNKTKIEDEVKIQDHQETPVEEKNIETVTKPKIPSSNSSDVKQRYIDQYNAIAMEEMRVYKIPASITLAQGILESRSGQSDLTTRSNNHFGIKCHKGWTGKRTYHDDDEKGECFRVYDHPQESFKDHSLFLAERTRYQDLFKLKITDYKGWSKGLKKAGYATDPRYPDKLIQIIEEYELDQYDRMVLGKKGPKKTKKNTEERKYHLVKKGDTLYSIFRKYDITVNELKKINGLTNNTISVDQKIYLE